MTFTANQYSQIAQSYDNAAGDPSVPKDKREEFAKRAEWFRYLAQRDKGSLAYDDSQAPPKDRSRAHSRSLLTTLWLIGGALYLISTLLFTNAIGLFGDDGKPTPVKEVSLPIERPTQTASVEDKETAENSEQHVNPAVERPHAISLDQPSYEGPELIVPRATEQELTGNSVVAEPTQQAEVSAPSSSEPEMLKVTEAATIRNGPSRASKVIGTASQGAELQVKERANGWIQFVDPSSGNSGWIESQLVAGSLPRNTNGGVATSSDEATNLTPKKTKPVKKGARQKSKEPKVAQPPSRPSAPRPRGPYAYLPDDGDFFIEEVPGPVGPFARRRMLREGLMSPGFLPPQ